MDTTAATQVAELVLQIVFALVGLLVAAAANKGKRYLEAKTGIELSAKQEEMLNEIVAEGIAFAEEKTHQLVKKQTQKLSGPEKLETAADFVMGAIEARGWDDYARDRIKDKIEAMLGSDRER